MMNSEKQTIQVNPSLLIHRSSLIFDRSSFAIGASVKKAVGRQDFPISLGCGESGLSCQPTT
jgi:hypothetical protein